MALGFRTPLFGSGVMPGEHDMPRRRMPFPNMPGGQDDEMGANQIDPTAARKPGLFGSGGFGRHLLGSIGDALAQVNGVEPVYAQALAAKRAQAKMQQQREADWEDFQRQYQYKIANPAPVNNDTTNDYAFIREKLGEEAANQYLRNLGDPMVTMQLPGNRVYSGPRSGMSGALQGGEQAGAPERPVGKLTPITGGQPVGMPPFANPPERLRYGMMTSGRRTVEGNAAVGGVPDSKHITGKAGDWSGPDLNALLGEVRKLPGTRRAFIHNNNHVHGEGDWDMPYFGKRGTKGKR